MSLISYKFLTTYFGCTSCKEISSMYFQCGHLFCSSCIRLPNNNKPVSIRCPFCSTTTTISECVNDIVNSIVNEILSLNDNDFQREYMSILNLIKSNKQNDINVVDLLINIKKSNVKMKNTMHNDNSNCVVKKRKFLFTMKPSKPKKGIKILN